MVAIIVGVAVLATMFVGPLAVMFVAAWIAECIFGVEYSGRIY